MPARSKSRIHRKAINTPGHAHELTFSCYQQILFLIVNDPGSDTSDKKNPSEREFMSESRALLRSILEEEIARPSWPAAYLLTTTRSEKKPWWKLW